MPNEITDTTIADLQVEAAIAGDDRMVARCRRALDGSARARREIARYLQGVRHEQVMAAMAATAQRPANES
jgi:hypothetical protein